MQFIIKCGGDNCGREFKAETEDRMWQCPFCDHEIPNRDYPFLSARLMEAKRVPEETDWHDLLDLILRKARVKMMENNLLRMEQGLEKVSLKPLIELEEKLDSPDLDFQELTLSAIKELGNIIKEQEEGIPTQ